MAAQKSSAKPGASKSKTSGLSALKKLVIGAAKAAATKGGKSVAAKAPSGKKAAPAVPTKAGKAATPVKAAKGAAPAPVVAAPVAAAATAKGKRAAASKALRSSSGFQAAQALAAVKNMSAPVATSSDASGVESVCREVACENLATTGGYCRLHYIKNWKKIKRKELILREKKLNQYIEELVAKYPDKYIEAIRQDLASDKDFAKVISDLDLDESVDEFESESGEQAEGLIDNMKRDFDGDDEAF